MLGLTLVPLRACSLDRRRPARRRARTPLRGAALGGGLLWIVGFVHARICAALGRRFEHWPERRRRASRAPSSLDYWTWFPGMGFGDVKLLAMIGAFVGPVGVIETILAASVAGLVLGLGWAARHARTGTRPSASARRSPPARCSSCSRPVQLIPAG